VQVVAVLEHRSKKITVPLDAVDADATVTIVEKTHLPFLGYLVAAAEVKRHFRKSDPDLVLGDHAGLASLLVVALGTWYGVPAVVRLGGNPARIYRERRAAFRRRGRYGQVMKYVVLQSIAQLLFRYADGFVVVSEDLRDRIVPRVTCSPDRVVVVPPVIDVDRYDGANGTAWRERVDADQLILTVTNLSFRGKYDGVRDSISGIAPVLAANADAAYVVAGDGLYYDDVVAFADRRIDDESVRERVHLPGFVSDVADLYASADLVVYVSYIDGYPNVVRESQAVGLPVVATPGYGVSEQIEDGVDGFLIDDTRESLRETVTRLLADPDERDRVAVNARARVSRENAPQANGEAFVAALSDLA